MTMLDRIKRINSHVGYGRYLAACDDTPFVIARQTDIPSPYASGPDHTVYAYQSIQHVIIVETAHKQYDVFAVPSTLLQPRED
jgi:hypothetical protein